jgi:hypothetical protein
LQGEKAPPLEADVGNRVSTEGAERTTRFSLDKEPNVFTDEAIATMKCSLEADFAEHAGTEASIRGDAVD